MSKPRPLCALVFLIVSAWVVPTVLWFVGEQAMMRFFENWYGVPVFLTCVFSFPMTLVGLALGNPFSKDA